jgi:hypothetical protein
VPAQPGQEPVLGGGAVALGLLLKRPRRTLDIVAALDAAREVGAARHRGVPYELHAESVPRRVHGSIDDFDVSVTRECINNRSAVAAPPEGVVALEAEDAASIGQPGSTHRRHHLSLGDAFEAGQEGLRQRRAGQLRVAWVFCQPPALRGVGIGGGARERDENYNTPQTHALIHR